MFHTITDDSIKYYSRDQSIHWPIVLVDPINRPKPWKMISHIGPVMTSARQLRLPGPTLNQDTNNIDWNDRFEVRNLVKIDFDSRSIIKRIVRNDFSIVYIIIKVHGRSLHENFITFWSEVKITIDFCVSHW